MSQFQKKKPASNRSYKHYINCMAWKVFILIGVEYYNMALIQRHEYEYQYTPRYMRMVLLWCLLMFHGCLQWRHNGHQGFSNHQYLECLLKLLFRRTSKKTSKLRVTGLYEGNPPVISGFPSQRASNAENISILWRHHGMTALVAEM